MTRIELPSLFLQVPADRLYAFLADLTQHREFLEPDALDFKGDPDCHRYKLEVMGMRLPLEMSVQERLPCTRVVLAAGPRKSFDQTLRYEIESGPGPGCTLRMSDEADIPLPMAMMGAEKILKAQLERSLARIAELVAAGKI